MKHTISHSTTTVVHTGTIVMIFLIGAWASIQCIELLDIAGSLVHDLYVSIAQAIHIRLN